MDSGNKGWNSWTQSALKAKALSHGAQQLLQPRVPRFTSLALTSPERKSHQIRVLSFSWRTPFQWCFSRETEGERRLVSMFLSWHGLKGSQTETFAILGGPHQKKDASWPHITGFWFLKSGLIDLLVLRKSTQVIGNEPNGDPLKGKHKGWFSSRSLSHSLPDRNKHGTCKGPKTTLTLILPRLVRANGFVIEVIFLVWRKRAPPNGPPAGNVDQTSMWLL